MSSVVWWRNDDVPNLIFHFFFFYRCSYDVVMPRSFDSVNTRIKQI